MLITWCEKVLSTFFMRFEFAVSLERKFYALVEETLQKYRQKSSNLEKAIIKKSYLQSQQKCLRKKVLSAGSRVVHYSSLYKSRCKEYCETEKIVSAQKDGGCVSAF
jgi:hypothetical protein